MSVITNSLAMMDTSSAVTSLDADAVVYDNTTSGLTATDAQAAIDELSGEINGLDLDATDIAFTAPSASGHSTYGANTDTVQEALNDINDAMRSVLQYGYNNYYYVNAQRVAYNGCGGFWSGTSVSNVEEGLNHIGEYLDNFSPSGDSDADEVSFTRPQNSIYDANTDTVQEALEDVSAKVLDLAASDIVYVNGCGGSYPEDVETVHDALQCLQHLLLKYSEFEEETGWLWFNDKPIYQVSIEEIESGTTNLFDTNELEIDDLVYMEATLTNSGGTKRWTISGSSGDFYWNTVTHMIVYGGSDIVTTATIRYTKTSD